MVRGLYGQHHGVDQYARYLEQAWVERATLTIGDKSGSFTVTTAASAFADNGDGTVTDSETGLEWMRCSWGQTVSGATCADSAVTFTWAEANSLAGQIFFASKPGWRVPTVREMQSIVDTSIVGPSIVSSVFPQTPSSHFWTTTPDATSSQHAWRVNFSSGESTNDGLRTSKYAVRLVRDGQNPSAALQVSRPTSDFVDHGNGTLTHTATGLSWQRCAKGQVWSGTACTGTATGHTGHAAAALTDTVGGYSDWRLPTVVELATLVDFTRTNPAANVSLFSEMPRNYFWSKSPSVLYSFPTAWLVHFGTGTETPGDLNYAGYNVRLVRGKLSYQGVTATPSDSECFFDWAEMRLPTLLTPAKQPTLSSGTVIYRSYPSTSVFFGLDGTLVLAKGGVLGADLLSVGQLADYLPAARAANCK